MSSDNMRQHPDKMRQHPVYTSYCADGKGNVYNIERPDKPMSPTLLNSGYLGVLLTIPGNKRKKHYLIHRFTYECYHGLVARNVDVHHIDGNRTNNCIDNLEPLLHKTNVQLRHGYRDHIFEHIDTLPPDAIVIRRIKKNEFDNLYYVPSTDSFYIQAHNKYVKRIVDKDNRIHVMRIDGKMAHHKVNVIKKLLAQEEPVSSAGPL